MEDLPAGTVGNPVLIVAGVSKTYGDHVVLDDVSLTVAEGQVTAVIGPSGAGKSTLLRMVNLLESPDAGRVVVAGQEYIAGRHYSTGELARLRRVAGMVFQSFNLFPHMTVLRNITLPQQRVLGCSAEEASETAYRLLDRVGLRAKADTYPAKCSGGQQQRIAIARALALNPRVMLFDEPTSALDPELGLEVLQVMRQLSDDGMTMLVVTHEMHFARDVADEVIVMADGGIVERGTASEVLTRPRQQRTRAFLRAVLER